MRHQWLLSWTLYTRAIGLGGFQVGVPVNRQGHDESTRDNLAGAEAKGVLQSCSKAVCSIAHQTRRECSLARALPPVTR